MDKNSGWDLSEQVYCQVAINRYLYTIAQKIPPLWSTSQHTQQKYFPLLYNYYLLQLPLIDKVSITFLNMYDGYMLSFLNIGKLFMIQKKD